MLPEIVYELPNLDDSNEEEPFEDDDSEADDSDVDSSEDNEPMERTNVLMAGEFKRFQRLHFEDEYYDIAWIKPIFAVAEEDFTFTYPFENTLPENHPTLELYRIGGRYAGRASIEFQGQLIEVDLVEWTFYATTRNDQDFINPPTRM